MAAELWGCARRWTQHCAVESQPRTFNSLATVWYPHGPFWPASRTSVGVNSRLWMSTTVFGCPQTYVMSTEVCGCLQTTVDLHRCSGYPLASMDIQKPNLLGGTDKSAPQAYSSIKDTSKLLINIDTILVFCRSNMTWILFFLADTACETLSRFGCNLSMAI